MKAELSGLADYLKLCAEPGKLVAALKNPRAAFRALRALRRGMVGLSEICRSIGVSNDEFVCYVKEIRSKAEFDNRVLGKLNRFRSYAKEKGWGVGVIGERYGEALYALVRWVEPDIVLETGVASGLSSAYILCALEENNKGRLFSIDLPYEVGKTYAEGYFKPEGEIWPVPKGEQPGWIIPGELRHRWELIIGRSSEKLPPLLEQLKSMDIFLHDSEHSYENMKWEYQTIWPYLKEGGLLLSHDIDRNGAFSEFCNGVGARSFVFLSRFGGIVKSLRNDSS